MVLLCHATYLQSDPAHLLTGTWLKSLDQLLMWWRLEGWRLKTSPGSISCGTALCKFITWNSEMLDITPVTMEHTIQVLHFMSWNVSNLYNTIYLLNTLLTFKKTFSFSFSVTESLPPEDDTIELHCFLNTYKGYRPCHNSRIHIKWSTEDNTPLNGNRFHYTNPSECFSKLSIKKRLTDNYRKWKCQLLQNDTVQASISYTTTVKGTELDSNVLQIEDVV